MLTDDKGRPVRHQRDRHQQKVDVGHVRTDHEGRAADALERGGVIARFEFEAQKQPDDDRGRIVDPRVRFRDAPGGSFFLFFDGRRVCRRTGAFFCLCLRFHIAVILLSFAVCYFHYIGIMPGGQGKIQNSHKTVDRGRAKS